MVSYNGGAIDVDLSRIDTILLYGATGSLPVDFLDDLNQHKICLLLHRRNIPSPYVFMPGLGTDVDDLLSAQILDRANGSKCAYVARTLIREKLASSSEFSPVSSTVLSRLAACRNVDEVRQIEATQAARYWQRVFSKLGKPNLSRRETEDPVNAALDACSFFLSGILLRWVLFHRLSAHHGFLHEPTGYISLVYDLMEPYRHWIALCVMQAAVTAGTDDTEALTQHSIVALKAHLEGLAYVPCTRQTVRRKALLHGAVLALRAWLIGKQARFVLPVEGDKKGGRPPQVAFSIPGYPIN